MDAQLVILVDVVKAIEELGSGAVRGCEPRDVRDMVLHLNRRLAALRLARSCQDKPGVTVRDEYALEVILRAVRGMATEEDLWVAGRAMEYLDERLKQLRGRRKKGQWNRDDEWAVEMVMRLFSVVMMRDGRH